jgi:hypothetical protein
MLTVTDNFDNSTDYFLADGKNSPNGIWNCHYTSSGIVQIRKSPDLKRLGRVIYLKTPHPTAADDTKSILVLTNKEFKNFEMICDMRTISQTATSFRAPNRWEVAWLMFRFTDDWHHYWVMTYSDGHMEMGRKDYAFPQEQQIFLIENHQVPQEFIFGKWYNYKIRCLESRITIWVDGVKKIDVKDDGSFGNDSARGGDIPYAPSPTMYHGHCGFYIEDCEVEFDNLNIKSI